MPGYHDASDAKYTDSGCYYPAPVIHRYHILSLQDPGLGVLFPLEQTGCLCSTNQYLLDHLRQANAQKPQIASLRPGLPRPAACP